MSLDNLIPTKDAGVFYVEHSTRKYGVAKDKKIVLRYTINKNTKKEVYGWLSQGYSFKAAALKIEEFRKNFKEGHGPVSLMEEREQQKIESQKSEQELLDREREEERKNLTLDMYFNGDYLDAARTDKPGSVGTEESLYKTWVKPTMGHLKFWEVTPSHFDKLKRKVLKGSRVVDPETGDVTYEPRSARTLHYCVSIVIQAWNMAFDNKKVGVQPPRRKTLKLPMIDNEKTRAFTPEEAKKYFEALGKRSKQWHDISLIALYAGLRASEVFKLKVEDFDSKKGVVFLRSPKKQLSQTLVLNDKAIEILKELKKNHSTKKGLFFRNRKGEQVKEVSDTVERVITALGFNEGVEDDRDKLTFHSLRHTFATWLIDYGDSDIFTISKLLRHTRLSVTKKYIHPDEERMRDRSQAICGVMDSVKLDD